MFNFDASKSLSCDFFFPNDTDCGGWRDITESRAFIPLAPDPGFIPSILNASLRTSRSALLGIAPPKKQKNQLLSISLHAEDPSSLLSSTRFLEYYQEWPFLLPQKNRIKQNWKVTHSHLVRVLFSISDLWQWHTLSPPRGSIRFCKWKVLWGGGLGIALNWSHFQLYTLIWYFICICHIKFLFYIFDKSFKLRQRKNFKWRTNERANKYPFHILCSNSFCDATRIQFPFIQLFV